MKMIKCSLMMLKSMRDGKCTFFKPFNGEVIEDSRNRERESREMGLDPRLSEPVNKKVIKGTLRKMPNGKSDEPDQIPVEVLK